MYSMDAVVDVTEPDAPKPDKANVDSEPDVIELDDAANVDVRDVDIADVEEPDERVEPAATDVDLAEPAESDVALTAVEPNEPNVAEVFEPDAAEPEPDVVDLDVESDAATANVDVAVDVADVAEPDESE
jgi:hypothetical protein